MLITRYAIKWKSSVVLMMLVFIIFGSLAYVDLPRESMPEVKIPFVMVLTVHPGVSPEDIESLVTQKIEKQLKGLSGVKEVTAYSSESVSNIMIEFQSDVIIDDALQRVKDKVDMAKNDLPSDLPDDPQVIEINTSEFPVMVAALSGDIPEKDLKKYADDLQEEFEGVAGVLEVDVSGARDREILVVFDYGRLQSYGLSIDAVSNAIKAENVNIPGGSIDIGRGKYLVRTPGEFTHPTQIENVLVSTKEGKPVYLKDVASVYDAFADKDSYARLNGEDAISLSIKKRTGANIIDMAEDIRVVIDKYNTSVLPPTVSVTLTMDQSVDILHMVHELENHLVTGLILVVLVLFFFLGKLNSFFTALAIPLSMLMSFIIFDYLGITLNMMVLFSLIMALGMLVDDAIVIVENIYRQMQEGKGRVEAAIAASEEVGWPIVASTLTKIFAFLPMAFWPGIMGDFMKYLPITLMVTLGSSLFVALVFNPVMCTTFMKVKKGAEGEEGELKFGKFMRFYMRSVDYALDHRALTIVVTIVTMMTPILLFGKFGAGMEFFPSSDPAVMYIRASTPQGTAAVVTNDYVKVLEEATKGEPDIEFTVAEVGGAAAMQSESGGTTTHRGRLTVDFVDFADRQEPSPDTITRIRERVGALPGAEIIIEEQQNGPPTGAPVSIEISGAEVDVMGAIAQEIRDIIKDIPGLVDLQDDYVKAKPEFVINVDREKAALLGLSTSSIGSTVRNAIYGVEVGTYREGDDDFDIKVRLPEENRQSIDDLLGLKVATKDGDYVPISSVADITLGAGFGTITRLDFQRVVSVTANADGRSSVEVMADVMDKLKDFQAPEGYSISFTGETEDQQEASSFLSKAFIVALFLILMVLMIEFNSVSQTMIILATVLLSLGGVFWGLLITGSQFGIIMTGIGVISLAGIVVNNGIILIDYTNKLREKGTPMREAIIHGGAVRFRPVLLTAVTAIFGMLPMAIGYGLNARTFMIEKGAEMSQWWGAMANAIIFGLSFATVLTLIVVPVLYSFTGGGLKHEKAEGRKKTTLKDVFAEFKK